MPVIRSPLFILSLAIGWLPCPTAAQVTPATGSPDVVPAGARLEEVWNAGEFTEGVAVAPDGTIYFSDIPRGDAKGRVLKFDPVTGETTVFCDDSRKSNGLMFDRTGRLIAACGANGGARALCEIGPKGLVRPLVDSFEGKAFNAPNDLIIHADGTIYFSDPRYVGSEPIELDHVSVYRFDPRDKSVRRVTTDITKPNGVELSPDGQTLYVAETDNGSTGATPAPPEGAKVRMTLNAFPVQPDGSLGKRRVLVDFGQKLGVDGLTVDAEGRIYAAVRSDDRFGIRVYTPEGTEIASLPTPTLPTNCCFGIGEERSTLYITAGGGLYRVRLKGAGYHPFWKD
jgi:gluconolactonase